MPPDYVNTSPLLDPTVLDRLREELRDDGVWTAFAQNFLELLPDRTERLRTTLTTGDLSGALDAVLSLRTSSQMVGAKRLGDLAFDLERALRLHVPADPDTALPRLAVAHLRPIVKCERQTAYLLWKNLHAGTVSR